MPFAPLPKASSYFLQAVAAISYAHEPLLAPPPDLLKTYRSGKDWPAYETGFLAIMQERGVPANPGEAQRSICGCETQNLRLELCANEIRATLALSSGEVLRDLPFADRDWRGFIDNALAPTRGANLVARLERFLNSQLHYKIMSCPHHFIRLGLTRPFHDFCWLMLDTLFPLPQPEWLEEFS